MTAPGVWSVDAGLVLRALTEAATVRDWSAGGRVDRETLIDHCYERWRGAAVLDDDGLLTRVTAPGAHRLHDYVPTDASYLCLEPVSHRPDALNTPSTDAGGVIVLQDGESLRLDMRIKAVTAT